MSNEYYCPFCCREISPAVDADGNVITGTDGGVIYVHDEGVSHDDDFNFGELH
ncbi:MAG: hypothetical protein ACRCUK_13700 [Plesiomonas shigelloides]